MEKVICVCMSHIKLGQDIFLSYLLLKCSDDLPSKKQDMTQKTLACQIMTFQYPVLGHGVRI